MPPPPNTPTSTPPEPVNVILYRKRDFIDVVKNLEMEMILDYPDGPNVTTTVFRREAGRSGRGEGDVMEQRLE